MIASTIAGACLLGYAWKMGVEEPYVMDGGWRGKIRIVPEPPIGKYRLQTLQEAIHLITLVVV